ncbi:major facilitator superfamily domain-containing protein [Exophiala viscosa]|uniref:major facilitator superfamily domain-containing protein n=1 Tax=Exophiala viscosa TaxID=2486360 RepID=UPI00219B0C67|nr:major facilitator superfamily domain-containing protein [Exophiala viscosa]
MAVTSNQSSVVAHAIEPIELPAIQPVRAAAPASQSDKQGEDQIQAVAEPGQRRNTFRTCTVISALFATLFIIALNTTIVATAIPTICSELHAASGYSWIGASYVIATTAVVSIWAKLSDIWGRKPLLLIAVALYFASSILCAVSTNMGMLIIGRTLQGVSGGGLGPLINIVISDFFSLRTRPLFLGLLHVTYAVAGGLGPVLGGALTEYVSWRWIFWINLPIAGIAFCLLFLFLDVHNPKTKFADGIKAVDWAGSISIVGIMVMVLLGLNFGGATYSWSSSKVICLVAVGASMTILFLVNEGRFARYPIMPLGLFRCRSNAACLIIGFTQNFVVNAADYYLPLYFQSAKEASPLRSGVLILPMIIVEALTAVASGILIHQTGRYVELIWIGGVVLTIGFGLFVHLTAMTSLGSMVAFQVVAGLGAGVLFDPPTIALQALVTQDDTATATATLSFMRSVGTSISIVIGGVIFQNGMQLQTSNLRDKGLPADLLKSLSGADAASNVNLIATIADQTQKLAVKQAFAWSLRNFWIMCTCMAACGLLAGGLITKKELSQEHTETQTGIRKEKNDVAVEPGVTPEQL